MLYLESDQHSPCVTNSDSAVQVRFAQEFKKIGWEFYTGHLAPWLLPANGMYGNVSVCMSLREGTGHFCQT